MMNTDIQVSFVVPVYSETGEVETFLRGLIAEADQLGERYEIVVVGEASSDETDSALRRLALDFGCLRILELSHAFGVEVALTAGVEAASGAAVITFDRHCDNWRGIVGSLLAARGEGVQVVDAVGLKTVRRTVLARLDSLLGATEGVHTVDMRLITKPVIEAIKASGWSVCLPAALTRHGAQHRTIRHEGTATLWCPATAEARPTWRFWALWGGSAGTLLAAAVMFFVMLISTFAGHGSVLGWGVTCFAALLGVQLFLIAAVGRQVALHRSRLAHEALYIVRDTTRLQRADDASAFANAGYVVYT